MKEGLKEKLTTRRSINQSNEIKRVFRELRKNEIEQCDHVDSYSVIYNRTYSY